MKTIITLTRVYEKTISFKVEKDLLTGMTEDEIGEFLFNGYEFNDEQIEKDFSKQEYNEISFNENSIDGIDTDRYDIFKGDKQIYGGHL